jgi:hypothetical protein
VICSSVIYQRVNLPVRGLDLPLVRAGKLIVLRCLNKLRSLLKLHAQRAVLIASASLINAPGLSKPVMYNIIFARVAPT